MIEESDSKVAIVKKFKEMLQKMDEDSSATFYPYSTFSSAVPIISSAQFPNTYTELKRYVPSTKPLVKNSDDVYGQLHIGSNTTYTDWN